MTVLQKSILCNGITLRHNVLELFISCYYTVAGCSSHRVTIIPLPPSPFSPDHCPCFMLAFYVLKTMRLNIAFVLAIHVCLCKEENRRKHGWPTPVESFFIIPKCAYTMYAIGSCLRYLWFFSFS